MDRRERVGDAEETLRMALESQQSKMYTALPAVVVDFDPIRQTVNVQPTIAAVVRQEDGTFKATNLPLLLDCPVQFPSGGGVVMTMPIAKGNEGLVVFASRCIDAWWQLGGIQNPMELRMHDLSDGFFIPGVRNQMHKFTDTTKISLTDAQIRSEDGSTVISLNPTSQKVTITAPYGLTVNADITVNGKITATGDVIGQGTSLHTHKHSGVSTGSAQTGQPV